MNKPPYFLAALLVGLLGLTAIGCGDSTASVTGSISYNGAPITKGMVTFTPDGIAGSVVGA
jgi:hypothetical protein